MKESPHEPLTEEQDKRNTIKDIVWASVVVFGTLALLVHGIAFLSWTEPTMEEIYRNKKVENRVERIETFIIETYPEYRNHTHVYSTGLPKTAK